MYEEIKEYIDSLMEKSTPDKPAWNMEKIRLGRPASWNYVDGCMITALIELYEVTKERKYFDFAERFIDYYINDSGEILGYDDGKFELDSINEGRVLFRLAAETDKDKYYFAIDRLREQLYRQPRTESGNFWHKKIYPDQVWLDGIYMADVFYAKWIREFGDGEYDDISDQILNIRHRMFSEEKKLYYHGMDESKTVFWADPKTGCSKSFWLRAIGWYLAALVDLIEVCAKSPERDTFEKVFGEAVNGMSAYADENTGMYYQVVDQPGREGNYLETSGSSMVAYAMLKGARLGVLSGRFRELGRKTFKGICDNYLKHTESGPVLTNICLVAGLGPEDNPRRDGSFEYYISEPVVENDAKGIAPFVLAYTEIIRE